MRAAWGGKFEEEKAMIFKKGLLNSLSSFVADHRLLSPSQGACLGGRQPFDTVFALRSLIEHRHTPPPSYLRLLRRHHLGFPLCFSGTAPTPVAPLWRPSYAFSTAISVRLPMSTS